MFYTLSKGLLWYLLALLLGFVIGYLIRSVICNRQVARLKGERSDSDELERLRGRVANLEPVVSERDRLRAELDSCREQVKLAAGASGVGGAAVAAGLSGSADAAAIADHPSDVDKAAAADVAADADKIESMAVRQREAEIAGTTDVDEVTVTETVAAADGPNGAVVADQVDVVETSYEVQGIAAPTTDVSGAKDVLGRKIKADDLTVVEGIGPAISKLCNGIGVNTWAELATTEVSLLRTMLDDAGPRFQMHDPETWPEQAALLAAGRWEDFQRLTDELDGGRRI